jgi:predicted secreted protein
MARPKQLPVARPHGGTAHRRFVPATTWLLIAAGAGVLTVSPLAGPVAGASTLADRVVLTNQSNGSTTVVTKGEQVVVKLHSDGFVWTEASVINASSELVLKKESGHVSSRGSSVTKFLVVGYGSATLQATGTAKCSSGPACGPPSVTWSANVVAPVQDPPA